MPTQPRAQGSLLSCAGKIGTPSLTKRIAASGNEIGADKDGSSGGQGGGILGK